MIKSVKIQNFQSHKDTTLDLHKGVNVIIGSSDSGKTAIIRALRWNIFNKPNGDAFRSHWGGDTSVIVKTDKHTIERSKKGKTGNQYKLDEQELVAFGANVPQSISDVFNMSDINLKQQFESHFLLNETPGKIAAFFNKVAHFEKIDTSLQKINSTISKLKRDITYNKTALKESKKELKRYAFLDSFEIALIKLEKKQERLEQIQNEIKKIDRFIFTFSDLEKEKEKHKNLLKNKTAIFNLLKHYTEVKILSGRILSLSNITTDIYTVTEEIEEIDNIIVLEKPVNLLLSKLSDKAILHTKFKRLQTLSTNIRTIQKSVLKHKENVLKLKNKFHKEMGNVCILCGSKLKTD